MWNFNRINNIIVFLALFLIACSEPEEENIPSDNTQEPSDNTSQPCIDKTSEECMLAEPQCTLISAGYSSSEEDCYNITQACVESFDISTQETAIQISPEGNCWIFNEGFGVVGLEFADPNGGNGDCPKETDFCQNK